MMICDMCGTRECKQENNERYHKNCPMNDRRFFESVREEYASDEVRDFYLACSAVEAEGYCKWPRLREIIELCGKMGYKKVGIAFCMGLHGEAEAAARIMRQKGLEVVSAMCKTGGVAKETVGIPEHDKIRPGEFEPMCNPIAQARLLNREKTDLNVVVGLCVGHDSLFYKHADAYVTTLVTKDRVLAHNPAGALYCADTYLKF
ncbi:DUF1847 domain-containing protein [Synergistaceae bacterium OttesenSCG-928-I11]|nr:DUF1847 domain-containing protein [Synergistaceae bacterium OttesenSCG-928-I11]